MLYLDLEKGREIVQCSVGKSSLSCFVEIKLESAKGIGIGGILTHKLNAYCNNQTEK